MIGFLREVEDIESFQPEEFVEKLARNTLQHGCGDGSTNFDLNLLNDTFTNAISDLQLLQEKQKRKCEQLEKAWKEEEKKNLINVGELLERNKVALSTFHALDDRLKIMSTKVIHLGDQLQSVNVPRARAVEAQRLMQHFQNFFTPGALLDPVFNDPTRLVEGANIIQKLYSISNDFTAEKFDNAKKRISDKYNEIEHSLIQEFERAHVEGDLEKMRELAALLLHFNYYNHCVYTYINQAQAGAISGSDVFSNFLTLCKKNYPIMKEVFTNPERVMGKFVQQFFISLKFESYLSAELKEHDVDRNDPKKLGNYLKNLHKLYAEIMSLSKELMQFPMEYDETLLPKLPERVFEKYLDSYISDELRYLKIVCESSLQHYYEKKKHQRKQIPTGGFQDLKRDLQAVIGTRTNFNIAQIENYGGETFISEKLAVFLLDECKAAFQRCQMLSKLPQVPLNAVEIFEILLQYLMVKHLDYAIELGLQAVPIPENKNFPQIYFFDVVGKTIVIVRLMNNLFVENIIPLVISSPKEETCISKKRYVLESIEMKLDAGLERCVAAVVGWIKIFLASEQKNSDFKPDSEKKETLPSPACLVVVQNLSATCSKIRENLDDRNAETVLSELGVRFHRVIYDHLLQYQFNTSEAVYAVCDVIEYKKCAADFKIPLVTTLFDTLHALWNLLLVRPENLRQVCSGGTLAELDESVIQTFIQLRSDYKTQKLANFMKGPTL